MKQLFKFLGIIALAAVIGFVVTGCPVEPEDPGPVAVTGVTLDSSTAQVEQGKNLTLTATVTPANATNKAVTWSSSNTNVATVADGVVTGVSSSVGGGTATITVTTADGGLQDTCTVMVLAALPPGSTLVNSVTLPATLNLDLAGTASGRLTATVSPDTATNKTLNWTSSNAAVATVDGDGNVTAVGRGTATITAKAVYAENGATAGTCTVSVTGPNTVKITGLPATMNGSEIMVYLVPSLDIDTESEPEIGGNGTVLNGEVTFELYDSNGPWTGGGSLYAVLMIENEDSDFPVFYANKTRHNFGSNPNPVMPYSSFSKLAFSYKLGDILEMIGVNLGSTWSMTLDQLMQEIDGLTYAEMKEEEGLSFYKNEALTQEFSGSDTVNQNTTIYLEFPMEMMMGGDSGYNRGEQIGTITGTITLTNIPSPPPRVEIRVMGEGSFNWWNMWGTVSMSTVSGSTATVNWSIPVYEEDDFSPGEGSFQLWVRPSSSNEFSIEIPESKNISGANDNVGNLGTFSLASITLSGTINVTFGGNPVPRVEISAWGQGGGSWTQLRSPGANAAWSMVFPAFDTPTEIRFYVSGWDRYDDNSLFWEEVETLTPITVQNTNVTGITIDLGDIMQ